MGSFFVFVILGVFAYLVWSRTSRSDHGRGGARAKGHSRASNGMTISIEVPGERRKVDPAANAQKGDKLWVAAGEESQVAGHAIPGGMVYVGKGLAPIGGWQDSEPALIDPSIPVAHRNLDYSGELMGYWPSYSDIDPKSRGAYLEWLADGRLDPDTSIGYVFLFLYGLERRLLFDLVHLPDRRDEAPVLIAEVERLLSVYGESGSFGGYGIGLLNAARILWDDTPATARIPSPSQRHGEVPADVRIALGQLVTAGEPIPAKWALAWVMGHPETRLRTPARRCPEEFKQLFLARYRDKYGKGITLKPNKRRLKITYRPASASFGGEVMIPVGDLPDVGALSRPIRLLQEIAETATAKLEGFSRFIGRNPLRVESLEALALLPRELAMRRQNKESQSLNSWIGAEMNGLEQVVVAGSEVMLHWPCAREDRMSKSELGSFAQILESFGYAVEPDPRFGGAAVKPNQKVVLFKSGTDPEAAPSAEYRAATLLLHLTAFVAASDGDISEAEERHLEEHLESSMHFSDGEVRRLRAHLQWLLSEQPSLAGVKRRIEGMDAKKRRLLAEFAVTIAGADGVIDPGEVKTITKIYKLLGFDSDQAIGDIHSLQTGAQWSPAERPVTVRPAGKVDARYGIPKRPQPETLTGAKEFQLDMDRVERTLAETAAVSSVLAEIFVDEDKGPVAPQLTSTGTSAGLDPPHSQLLQAVDGRSELSREEFEALAEGLGLLSDGAYETLNEAAFERVDGPLLEGEDPISIDLDTLGEVMQ